MKEALPSPQEVRGKKRRTSDRDPIGLGSLHRTETRASCQETAGCTHYVFHC